MEYIGDCLNKKGGISSSSLDVLIKMMKNSENKLVSRFLALAIMSESEVDVQIKICESVIWNILFEWLEDGLKTDTTCFIIEILQLYLKLPVTLENLTSNDCSKLIKKLSKDGDGEVTSKAKSIVAKWEKIVNKQATSNRMIPCKKIKLDTKGVLTKDLDENLNNKDVEIDSANLQQISNKSILNTDTEKPDDSCLKLVSNFEKRKVCEIQESGNFINSIIQKPNPSRKRKKRQALSQILNKSAPDIKASEHQIANNNVVEVNISMESPVQKPKKRVSWASGDSFQSIKYFELDENERINVNKVSMEEMKRKEHLMERQNVYKNSNVIENESQLNRWYIPLKLLGVSLKNGEPQTEEKRIQELRERKFLKSFYFSRSEIPNSPGEPEKETFFNSEMKIIPMEISVKSKPVISEESILKQTTTEKEEDKAKFVKPETENSSSLNITESSLAATSSNYEVPQTKAKLIKIIKTSYPDIDPEKLSSEEVYKLLEPLRDQLIKEGILNSDSEKTVENQPKLSTCTGNIVTKDLTKSRMIFRRNGLVQPVFRPLILCPPQSHVFSNNFFRHPTTHIRPVCKFFSNGGYCRSGNGCTFSHILPNPSLNQNRK